MARAIAERGFKFQEDKDRELSISIPPEKQEKTVNIYFLNRKRQRRKEKSEMQKLLTVVSKKKNLSNIEEAIKRENIIADAKSVEFYKTLALAGTNVRGIHMMRDAVCKDINFSFLVTIEGVLGLTNDSLSLIDLFVNGLRADKFDVKELDFARNNDENRLNKLNECVHIKSVDVVSYSLLNVDEQRQGNFIEYYLEDFNTDVSIPFSAHRNDLPKKDLFGNGTRLDIEYEFDYNKVTYAKAKLGLRNVVYPVYVIYRKGKTADDINEVYNSMTASKLEQKKLSGGLKELKRKEGYYYYQKNFKLTNFCPNYLCFDSGATSFQDNINKWGFNFNLTLNIEDFGLMLTEATNKAILPKNFMTFSNCDAIYDMLEIFAVNWLASGYKEVKQRITAFLDLFKNFRELYPKWGQKVKVFRDYYDSFKKLCLNFIDSFSVRPNIDRMMYLIKQANDFILFDEAINKEQEILNGMRTLFKDCIFAELINNFLKNGNGRLASAMKEVCISAVNIQDDSSKIITGIRSIAVQIFDYFLDGKNPILDTVRSPNSFLGNVVGDDNEDTLRKYFNDLNTQYDVVLNNNYLEQVSAFANKVSGAYNALKRIYSMEDENDENKKFFLNFKYDLYKEIADFGLFLEQDINRDPDFKVSSDVSKIITQALGTRWRSMFKNVLKLKDPLKPGNAVFLSQSDIYNLEKERREKKDRNAKAINDIQNLVKQDKYNIGDINKRMEEDDDTSIMTNLNQPKKIAKNLAIDESAFQSERGLSESESVKEFNIDLGTTTKKNPARFVNVRTGGKISRIPLKSEGNLDIIEEVVGSSGFGLKPSSSVANLNRVGRAGKSKTPVRQRGKTKNKE